MDSKDLQTLIKVYNSHEDDIFDKCTDLFILKVRNELERMYKNDEWGKMTQVSDLGIYISKMCHDFKNFEFKILPFASGRNGKTISDVYGYMTFSYYIKYEEYKGSELCTFEDDDILAMKPFCEFLERKGFGCYVDTGDHELVVTLKIN